MRLAYCHCMPRKPLIRSTIHPYHVTARGNNKEPFPNSPEESWKILNKCLQLIHEEHQVKIHAFVMMNNHFHLLMSTPKNDLGIVMRDFMRTATRSMNRKSGRIGRIFGGSYHWSVVTSENYYDCVLKYIYRNPVKAGLIHSVELYPFSTIKCVLDLEKLPYKISPVLWLEKNIPNDDKIHFLQWLNQPFYFEDEAAIKNGLKKTSFAPPINGWKQNYIDLSKLTINASSIKK
jgi:putative transposase